MRLRATRLSSVGNVAGIKDPYGRMFLADAAAGLLMPPLSTNYTRSGPDLWCPQADGAYKNFPANVIPREWANGRWGFRFDPGWTQHALWTDEITAARGWNIAFITPEVNVGGISPPHPGGSYTRLTVNSAGLALIYRTATVTPGASETLSFMVRLGTLSASDLKFGIYNETAASWIAVDRVPAVTPTASGWTRCDVSVTIPAGCTTIRLYPFRNNFAAAGATFYLAMVNGTTTSYPVPLTVAQGTAGTVGNHSCSALLSALGITLGAEWTVGIDWSFEAVLASGAVAVSLTNSTYTDRATLYREPNVARASAYISASGAASYYSGDNTPVGSLSRQVLRVKTDDMRVARNGVLGQLDNGSSAMPVGVDRVVIGHALIGGQSQMPGYIHKLWLAPTRALTDAELQAVTA